MGKKASGKTYTSKGERKNVKASTLSAIRKERDPAEKIINVQKAWIKGQNPWVTMDNPNKEDKSRLKIRVRANELWGHPKERLKKMYVMTGA